MPPKSHPTSLQPLGAPERLLVNRVQTALMLGLSVPSVIRLELEGRLTAIKLSRKRSAMTFYARSQVCALAEGRPRQIHGQQFGSTSRKP
jgi:hypothetical protein